MRATRENAEEHKKHFWDVRLLDSKVLRSGVTHTSGIATRAGRLLIVKFFLTQGIGVTITYVRRSQMPIESAYTGFDHRNGWMGIVGAMAGCVSLAVMLTGHQWVMVPTDRWSGRHIQRFCLGRYVAFLLHQITLYMSRRYFPFYLRRELGRPSDAWAFFLKLLISILCLWIGVPRLLVEVCAARSAVRLYPKTPLPKAFYTGNMWRLLLVVCSLYVVAMRLRSDIVRVECR